MSEYTPTPHVPGPVQKAFNDTATFQWPSSDQVFRKRIEQAAELEARSARPLLLNEQGLTNGMLDACVDPVAELWDRFLQLKGAFDTAIHPYLEKIQALQESEQKISTAEEQSEKAQANTEKKHEANHSYVEAKKNVDQLKDQYDDMFRAEGQREAKDFPLPVYAALLLGVGATEWMVNYETFLKFAEVPLMAAGATILVALAVAVAAHYHGSMLKGYQHYFGEHIELPKKNRNIRVFAIVSIVLAIAFGCVGGARYLLVANEVSQLGGGAGGLLGAAPIEINVGQIVTVSMAINMFVWFVGAAIAYAVHDDNPLFTEKRRELKKAKKIFDPMRTKADMEILQLRAKLANNIEKLKNTANALEQEAKPLAELNSTILEKTNVIHQEADRTTKRLIRNYRSALAAVAAVENPGLQFNKSGQLCDLETFRQDGTEFSFQTASGIKQ